MASVHVLHVACISEVRLSLATSRSSVLMRWTVLVLYAKQKNALAHFCFKIRAVTNCSVDLTDVDLFGKELLLIDVTELVPYVAEIVFCWIISPKPCS